MSSDISSMNSYIYGHFQETDQTKFVLGNVSNTGFLTVKNIDVKITSIYKFFEYILNLCEALYKTKITKTCVVLKVSESQDFTKSKTLNVLISIEEICNRTGLDFKSHSSKESNESAINKKLDDTYLQNISEE